MDLLLSVVRARLARQDGQTMAEYAVVLGVIAVAIVVALTFLSGQISTGLKQVGSDI